MRAYVSYGQNSSYEVCKALGGEFDPWHMRTPYLRQTCLHPGLAEMEALLLQELQGSPLLAAWWP